ncbi:hypothetical protein FS763_01350 [Agrobacterium vitis]|uniref:hypothetical protein n=1 Tax=Allorhizobium ampelinum TaxID=3025782 RepID=UPI001F20A585|nr:hypothetical protein [Allorhizobium ampelinum]MCF1470576.1 hypothetical protein [Allorhizobium ampelinum]
MRTEPQEVSKPSVEMVIRIPDGVIMSSSSAAIRDVICERLRQIIQEDFKPENDDRYQNGELEDAAYCYAAHATLSEQDRATYSNAPPEWPFAPKWWKPTTPEGDLIKSAALSIAALEVRYRAAVRKATAAAGDAE